MCFFFVLCVHVSRERNLGRERRDLAALQSLFSKVTVWHTNTSLLRTEGESASKAPSLPDTLPSHSTPTRPSLEAVFFFGSHSVFAVLLLGCTGSPLSRSQRYRCCTCIRRGGRVAGIQALFRHLLGTMKALLRQRHRIQECSKEELKLY